MAALYGDIATRYVAAVAAVGGRCSREEDFPRFTRTGGDLPEVCGGRVPTEENNHGACECLGVLSLQLDIQNGSAEAQNIRRRRDGSVDEE